jgi:hypothetical protein
MVDCDSISIDLKQETEINIADFAIVTIRDAIALGRLGTASERRAFHSEGKEMRSK